MCQQTLPCPCTRCYTNPRKVGLKTVINHLRHYKAHNASTWKDRSVLCRCSVCLGLKEWGISTCYRHWEADADVRANPEEDRRASDDDAEEEGDQNTEEEGDSKEDADNDSIEEDSDNADYQVDETNVESANHTPG